MASVKFLFKLRKILARSRFAPITDYLYSICVTVQQKNRRLELGSGIAQKDANSAKRFGMTNDEAPTHERGRRSRIHNFGLRDLAPVRNWIQILGGVEWMRRLPTFVDPE